MVTGCDNTPMRSRQRRQRTTAQTEQDSVVRALDYLERIDEFDEKSARSQAAYQLNRWLDEQKRNSSWQPDEMVKRLPRVVREKGVVETLGRLRFDTSDVKYVQESVWMRQLSRWVSQQPLDPLFAKSFESRKSELGEFGTEQLGIAHRLFDWTVRNIQLDELLASPDEATAAPKAGTGDATATAQAAEPAAIRGIPGPGYQFEPTDVLLYGHGDVWQRMRVFTLMARQQRIDVVTLAFPGRTIPPRPRPWVSGVLLGNELYLFDMRLGMPIPRKGAEGVATLSEVLADPSLLKDLEIDEKHPYRIAPEDLAEVVALIDVVGPSLSQRLEMTERQLAGEHRTILSVPISPLAAKLRACKGITDVYLWSVPFEANWYSAAVENRLQNDPQAAAQHNFKYSMFLSRSPLVRGRITYLRGQIENKEDQPGAKSLLSQTRISDWNLREIDTNEDMQQQLGIQRVTRDDQQWKAQLEMFKGVLVETKQHASFWLGMCQLESGRPDASIEWLKTRTLEAFPNGFWAALARYNLARAYEQQGDLAEAQRLLLSDKSLQEHGNYLRARLLEKHLAPQKSSEAKSVETKSPETKADKKE
jgi:hypothetical protein